MRRYITINSKGEKLPTRNADIVAALVADGAVLLDSNTKPVFQPNLVCVIYDVANFVDDYADFAQYTDVRNYNTKKWLIYKHAAELSSFR